jgi:hypothetical protein
MHYDDQGEGCAWSEAYGGDRGCMKAKRARRPFGHPAQNLDVSLVWTRQTVPVDWSAMSLNRQPRGAIQPVERKIHPSPSRSNNVKNSVHAEEKDAVATKYCMMG